MEKDFRLAPNAASNFGFHYRREEEALENTGSVIWEIKMSLKRSEQRAARSRDNEIQKTSSLTETPELSYQKQKEEFTILKLQIHQL